MEINITITAIIAWLVAQWDLRVIATLIALDVVVNVAAAIKLKEFEWQRMGDFLLTNVLPYLIVYGGLRAASWSLGSDWDVAVYAVFAVIVATLLGSIATAARDMGLDIPLPGLTKAPDG